MFAALKEKFSRRTGRRTAGPLIFLHIPKTAGTSLRNVFEEEYGAKHCLQVYTHTPKFFDAIRPRAKRAKVIYGHVSYGIHEILEVQGEYVTFLRDPIERVISFYRHQARDPQSFFYQQIQEGLTLRAMLESEVCHQLNNHMTRIISGYPHIAMVDDDAVLEQALVHIDQYFRFVGIIEQMPESVERMGRSLQWRRVHKVPRLNTASNHTKIDEKTIACVRRYNRLDMALYERVQSRLNAW
jgi:hypothetical protein